MEIHSLKLFVTDADVATFAARALRDHETIEGLQVRLTPDGVLVEGEYRTSLFNVSFETMWHISASGPHVHVRLGTVKVAGLPAGLLRGALMNMIRDAVASEAGIKVADDSIIIHVPDAARGQGVNFRVHFTAVRMSIGVAVLEAGMLP
jgi:hypothetical protein